MLCFTISSIISIEIFLFLVILIFIFKTGYYKLVWLLFFIYILFLSPLSAILLKVQERRYHVLQKMPQDVSAIIVLGAGGTPEYGFSVYQRLGPSALQRCLEGVRLWKLDSTKLMLFSSQGRKGYPSQASLYAELAIDQGVNQESIFLLENGYNTESEAIDFKKSFPEVESLILVTSASHMRRASKIFLKYGIEVIPAPTDFKILIHPGGEHYNFLPSLNALKYWNILIHEWVGMFWVELGKEVVADR